LAQNQQGELAMKRKMLCTMPLVAVIACCAAGTAEDVTVRLTTAQRQDAGTATIKSVSHGVIVQLKAKNLSAGEHGIHFHQSAKCDPPDFKTAGPHFNPDGKKHGLKNPEGHHAGDMNNLTVAANGTARTTIVDNDVDLGDDSHSLFSNGGTSLIIHVKPDDMKTDPAGNSGDRIACGVITK
jgi:Cu-Zn family superoxide dismutase